MMNRIDYIITQGYNSNIIRNAILDKILSDMLVW